MTAHRFRMRFVPFPLFVPMIVGLFVGPVAAIIIFMMIVQVHFNKFIDDPQA